MSDESLGSRRYMIVERFKDGNAEPVYRRFRERGRLMPDGLNFISSWVAADLSTCYQLVESTVPRLLDEWIAAWDDLVDFEVIEVITSEEAARQFEAAAGTRPAAGEGLGRP